MRARLLRYVHTARHLTLRQWIYFPLRRLQDRIPRPALADSVPDARFAPGNAAGAAIATWGPRDDDTLSRATAAVEGEVRFIGRRGHLADVDWTGQHVSRLWTYNLHYFDYGLDLAWAARSTRDARFAGSFESLALDWIAATSGERGPGWEPYTASVRIVNWTYALLLLEGMLPPESTRVIAASLHRQLRWLERRIEWHILANHLQRNLQALALGGMMFEGRDAARWRRRFLPALWDQVLEQTMPDGGHFERAPMYHVIALVDLLETEAIARASGFTVPVPVRSRLSAMVAALRVLSRADGSLHLFNDSAEGIAPPVAYAHRLASAAGLDDPSEVVELPHTGYFLFVDEARGDRLLVDCGEPAVAYQPGHSHCDLLSFELDLAGRPVVVDSGVHGYDGDAYRAYVRSTRAHNTVTIDGLEQSEVWSTFRLARRADRITGSSRTTDGGWTFRGAYRPYHDRSVTHEREIVCAPGAVCVVDRVTAARTVRLDSYLHLHPDFDVMDAQDSIVARSDAVTIVIEPINVSAVTLHRGEMTPQVQGWYCPRFGEALPATAVTFRAADGATEFGYRIVARSPQAAR